MADSIPFDRLGVPDPIRGAIGRDAPSGPKLAMARGAMPATADVQLAALYVLAGDPDAAIASAAHETVRGIPEAIVLGALGQRTHAKVLEMLVEFREAAAAVDTRVLQIRNCNDRTARLVSRRAGPELCTQIAANHERLIMTPEVYVDLHANPSCGVADLEKAAGFLRMQGALPAVPAERPFLAARAAPSAPEAPRPILDLEKEIEAALMGAQSPALMEAQEQGLDLQAFGLGSGDTAADPALGDFKLDFRDSADEFSWNLIDESADARDVVGDESVSLEKQIGDMSVGKKIKLAYLGNKSSRRILIKDSNKMVAVAVVKSGRLTDGEVVACANDRNLTGEVLRELAANGEWTRKYPVKVGLASNPKTPVNIAVSMIKWLQQKDLQALARNRNVPSVVFGMAQKLYKEKYKV